MNANPAPLITMLSTGIGHCSLYFAGHPRVRASAEAFVKELGSLLDKLDRDVLFLGVVEGRLVHEGRFYLGPTAIAKRVVQALGQLKSGGFLFRRDTGVREVSSLFEFVAGLKDPMLELEQGRRLLQSREIESITLSPEYEDPDWFGQHAYEGTEIWRSGEGTEARLETLVPVYQSFFEAVEVAHGRAAGDHEIDIEGARGASQELVRVTQDEVADIMRLARYPDYDSYTIGHSVRVAIFAVMAGRHIGLPHEQLVELGAAGLLHDVGKSKVSDEILYKPGRLTEEERHEMSLHAELGAGILVENSDAGSLAIGCAFGHHLRADGKGYPELRPWVKTGPMTALMRVCDAFEGITAVRPYKAGVTPRRAFEILLADRGSCDAQALRALVGAVGFYPPGRRVLLASGERAYVIAVGKDPALPKVVVTHDARGEELPPDGREELDLGLAGTEGRKVVELYRDSDPVEREFEREHLDVPELAAEPGHECC